MNLLLFQYCCPDLVHTFLGITKTDCSGTSTKIMETEKGKLIMLVNDFYYGKYEGNVQQVHQEQKTHTTFKCASCMKLLKNNLRYLLFQDMSVINPIFRPSIGLSRAQSTIICHLHMHVFVKLIFCPRTDTTFHNIVYSFLKIG